MCVWRVFCKPESRLEPASAAFELHFPPLFLSEVILDFSIRSITSCWRQRVSLENIFHYKSLNPFNWVSPVVLCFGPGLWFGPGFSTETTPPPKYSSHQPHSPALLFSTVAKHSDNTPGPTNKICKYSKKLVIFYVFIFVTITCCSMSCAGGRWCARWFNVHTRACRVAVFHQSSGCAPELGHRWNGFLNLQPKTIMWGIVHSYVLSNSLNVQSSDSEINWNRCYLRWAISALLVGGVKYIQSLSTPQDLVTKWSTSSWSNSISGHSSSSGYSAWTLYSLEYCSLCFALLLLALVLSLSSRVTSHLFFSFISDNFRYLHDFCASCVFSFLQGETLEFAFKQFDWWFVFVLAWGAVRTVVYILRRNY